MGPEEMNWEPWDHATRLGRRRVEVTIGPRSYGMKISPLPARGFGQRRDPHKKSTDVFTVLHHDRRRWQSETDCIQSATARTGIISIARCQSPGDLRSDPAVCLERLLSERHKLRPLGL